MGKENTQQVIKNLKKQNKCAYPGCEKDSIAQIMLPIGRITESGQIEFPDNNIQSSCPLCEYHTTFAEKGILNLVSINGLVQLWGAYPIIEVVEAVIEAKKFEDGFKKALKKKNAKSKQTKKSK